MSSLNAREQAQRQRLKTDFEYFARNCLQIRSKSGAIEPLKLNRAQLHLHNVLEAQRQATGKVRAIVLKGRQQGISTYIGGRYYWRAVHSKGVRVFILTHEMSATDNLFGMVDRYHEHCTPFIKPSTGASNAKELFFDALESGYAVATAGSKAVGRSQTVQLFHGSEVAFWPNAATHFAGVVQAVPDIDGSEIILESTANGLGGEFHERWQQAEAGQGDYLAVFIPWFWQPEYVRPPDMDFALNEEEQVYQQAHGLSLEQMAWRRNKMAELKDPLLFKQEYPATAAEAFQATGHDSFIKPDEVLAARKNNSDAIGPLVLGVDPARFGDDGFAIAMRRGRKVLSVERRFKLDNVAGANWVRQMIDHHAPAKVFVDVGGVGAGVVDILKSWGGIYGQVVSPVNFGASPHKPTTMLPDGTQQPGAKNRRAEMWASTKEWLNDAGGADIPDDDGLQADACGPAYSYDVNQRLQLESKEHMRQRGLRSPDGWDAIALTFAEPVSNEPFFTGPSRAITSRHQSAAVTSRRR